MANYITSPILFESYVHIDARYEDIGEAIESISRELHTYIQDRSEHFLYEDVTSEVRFKKGSIKAYATVRGSLSQCLGLAYDNFSIEIDRLYWFAKRLSDAAVMEVTFKTGSFLRAIERTEARPGIVGATKRTIDRLNSIRAVDTEKAAGTVIRRIKRLRTEIQHLAAQMGYKEDIALIKTEFSKLLKLAPTRIGTRPLTKETEQRYASELDLLKQNIGSLSLSKRFAVLDPIKPTQQMEYASIFVSLLALSLSGFTFYWVNLREKKNFYLLRIDRMGEFRRPEFALVNGGSRHILVTTIECGFENEDNSCFYPAQRIEYGKDESLLIKSGSAIHCRVDFPEPFTSTFVQSGNLLSNITPEMYQHKFRVNVAWIDSHGDNFEASANVSNYGFRAGGELCMHAPLKKKYDLFKTASKAVRKNQ